MKYRARIIVYLKPAVSDPEGETVKSYLRDRGYMWIDEVRCGKFWEVIVVADSKKEANRLVEEICKDPLANVVKDNYDVFSLEEIK